MTNANQITGCFDLSNAITITRNQPVGGEISTSDNTTVCTLNGAADQVTVELEGAAGSNSLYLITDENLAIIGTQTGATFDFDLAPAGVCLLWHLSYEDDVDVEGLDNAGDLMGCFSLSNSITINRIVVDGATVTTDDELTSVDVIVGDGSADVVSFTNTSTANESYIYVITDEDNNIIGTAEESNDFEGAEAGVCRVWGLSYSGELTAEVGTNASEISTTECWDLSDDYVTINRELFDNVSELSDLGISVYPTVVESELFISGVTEAYGLTLTNLSGQIVLSQQINSGINTVTVTNLPAGAYIGTINTAENQVSFRIVKQ